KTSLLASGGSRMRRSKRPCAETGRHRLPPTPRLPLSTTTTRSKRKSRFILPRPRETRTSAEDGASEVLALGTGKARRIPPLPRRLQSKGGRRSR
ncbi:unnamed protein product, partial [Ectocarpus sp. 12 AP-2014]